MGKRQLCSLKVVWGGLSHFYYDTIFRIFRAFYQCCGILHQILTSHCRGIITYRSIAFGGKSSWLTWSVVIVAAQHRFGAPALLAVSAVCHWWVEPSHWLQSLVMLANADSIVYYIKQSSSHCYPVYQPKRRVKLFHSPQGYWYIKLD